MGFNASRNVVFMSSVMCDQYFRSDIIYEPFV